jgi:hypothetical protein
MQKKKFTVSHIEFSLRHTKTTKNEKIDLVSACTRVHPELFFKEIQKLCANLCQISILDLPWISATCMS